MTTKPASAAPTPYEVYQQHKAAGRSLVAANFYAAMEPAIRATAPQSGAAPASPPVPSPPVPAPAPATLPKVPKANRKALKALGVARGERSAVARELVAGGQPFPTDEAALKASLKKLSDVAFERLPDNVQKFVAESLPDDPVVRLSASRALYGKIDLVLNGGATTTSPPAEKPVTPATTLASQGSRAAPATARVDLERQYAEIRAKHPMLAGGFLAAHPELEGGSR